MNRSVVFLLAALPVSAFSDDLRQFNYLEGSIIKIEDREESDFTYKGFGFGGKASLNDNFYLSAKYDQYSHDYEDGKDKVDRRLIGFGFLTQINIFVAPFVEFNYVEVEQNYFDETVYQQRYTGGISGDIQQFSYKLGMNKYKMSDEYSGKDTTEFVEAGYWISEKISLGLGLERSEYSNRYDMSMKYRIK